MVCYKIFIAPKASKDLRKLPKDILRSISGEIDYLANNPRPTNCKKLKGAYAEEYRIRVRSDYRVLYQINDDKKLIHVLRILHRKESYR